MSKIPEVLRRSLGALALLAGLGGGGYVVTDAIQREAESNAYVQAVAVSDVSEAVKVAMVMGFYYESSNRHIGTPYVDKAGKGQPLTVCNGLTGPEVIASRYYSPAECFRLEKARYIKAEQFLLTNAGRRYEAANAFQQATFLDFVYNVGAGGFQTSTMRLKLLAGDIIGACREGRKWTYGTVNGVKTVLPGLVMRRESNFEICQEALGGSADSN